MGTASSSARSSVEVAEAGGGEAAVISPPVAQQPSLYGGGDDVESSNGSAAAAAGDTLRTGRIGGVRPTPQRKGGPVLDVLDIWLNALKNAGAITQLPYMKEAAGVLLQVVNAIQAVRDNQDAFIRLVDHAGCIILSATRTMQPPREITDDMKSALKKIHDVVLKIKSLSDNRTNRTRLRRFLHAGSDKVEIGKLREDLNAAVQIFGVDAAMILNADINMLTEYVRQLMNEARGSCAGDCAVADGPSYGPSSVIPPPLPEVSDVNIQDGVFTHISAGVDASNEGDGTQNIWAPNISSGVDGNVHMNSPVSRPRSRSRSRRSSRSPNPPFTPSTDDRQRNVRVSPSPPVVVLPEEDDHMREPLRGSPPPPPSPRRSSPALPRANSLSTSFSGVKIDNGAFNYVNSPCKVTNKGSGTQTFHGHNIATNVSGDVMMNCGNYKKIITSNSNNDYSTHHYRHSRRSGRPRGRQGL
ncbi:hypothetical protein PTI98_001939 [Pleurotus ostreatus]|nr:hypothetical protein PTI98_001939 [Pleurotus ostreatus]